MVTLGQSPGVRVTTQSGSVGGVTLGRSQYTIFIGIGESSGSASANEVVSITTRRGVEDAFGRDSDIAEQWRRATANGANKTYIRGIKASMTETTETVTSTSSDTLSNSPIIPDKDRITVTDTGDSTEQAIEFVYEDDPTSANAPDPSSGEVYINPNNGSWVAPSSSDYEFVYEYADWDEALQTARDAVGEEEFGVIVPLTHASSVTSSVPGVLTQMRDNIKMVLSVIAPEPTGTSESGFKPIYDTQNLTNALDDDRIFGPTPQAIEDRDIANGPDYGIELLGAYAGRMAGNELEEPVYNDVIQTDADLVQKLSRSEAQDLRGEYLIPVRQRGEIRLEDNLSTYDQNENGGWERDYFRRRIVDVVIATIRSVARRTIGAINDPEARTDVRDVIISEMRDLVNLDLLQVNGQSIDVYAKDKDTIGIDLGITPNGVTKQVDATLTVEV